MPSTKTELKSAAFVSPAFSKVLHIASLTCFSLLFAGITGLSAQLRFYLPFTPVPVTGQVLAVLLSGILLGKEFGSLSQVFYISFGFLGVPWFAVYPLVPTGGYLLGFIAAPFVIGLILEKRTKTTNMAIFLSLIAGVLTIYLFGFLLFAVFTQKGIADSFRLAVLPFIPFDIAKAIIAAGLSGLLHKTCNRDKKFSPPIKKLIVR